LLDKSIATLVFANVVNVAEHLYKNDERLKLNNFSQKYFGPPKCLFFCFWVVNPLRGRPNIALRQIGLPSSPNRLSNYISIILYQSTGFLEAVNHMSGFISSLLSAERGEKGKEGSRLRQFPEVGFEFTWDKYDLLALGPGVSDQEQ